ncbi:MAG: alpha-ketoglutarate-dependent dioxygenase AlkB [Planctomycetota bacterium]
MFQSIQLDPARTFQVASLPAGLAWNDHQFAEAWVRHPMERHRVWMIKRWVETPRWQQAYGANYNYTGSRNNALPIPQDWRPLLEWAQNEVDYRLNGLLLNWYEGRDHYIGAHHDSTKSLIHGSPIVTVSFGETRVFRLTKGKGNDRCIRDFSALHGTVFLMPWNTNTVWKHEVVKSAKNTGRRISVTFRAFEDGVLPPESYFDRAEDVAEMTDAPSNLPVVATVAARV